MQPVVESRQLANITSTGADSDTSYNGRKSPPAALASQAPSPAAKTTEPTASGATAPAPSVQAEVTAADIAPVAQASPPSPPLPQPHWPLLNLETFPKLKVKQEFDSHSMSVYYSTEGTVARSDESLMKEFTKAGWKEAKHLVTSTDQYVDRLLTKDGF